MLSISNLLCGHSAGNERLRYSHSSMTRGADDPFGGAPRPVVVWNITRACNLRCVHCYASASPGPAEGELTLDEGMALLDDIHEFGVPAVLISGGEPLARPDVFELLAHAQSIGLPTTLSTNGTLIDDNVADRLRDLGLRYVGISIDGKPEQHDKLRGWKGAFDGSLAAIDRCRDKGIKVGVRFTVHALNYADIDYIFEMCLKHHVQRLCVYHLAYAGRAGNMTKVDLSSQQTRQVVDKIFARTRQCHERNERLEVLTVDNHADAAYILLTLEKTDPALAAEAREKLAGTGGNRSGQNIACVDPTGNVHYDQFSWHYSCGNVRETPFSRIWSEATDPRLAMLRDRTPLLPERCRSCRFLSVCNGNLRTRAEVATGNWMGMDPSCYLTREETEIRADETAGAAR
jgi:radical SAM protein with 4Fe4S-binding SPASM domain